MYRRRWLPRASLLIFFALFIFTLLGSNFLPFAQQKAHAEVEGGPMISFFNYDGKPTGVPLSISSHDSGSGGCDPFNNPQGNPNCRLYSLNTDETNALAEASNGQLLVFKGVNNNNLSLTVDVCSFSKSNSKIVGYYQLEDGDKITKLHTEDNDNSPQFFPTYYDRILQTSVNQPVKDLIGSLKSTSSYVNYPSRLASADSHCKSISNVPMIIRQADTRFDFDEGAYNALKNTSTPADTPSKFFAVLYDTSDNNRVIYSVGIDMNSLLDSHSNGIIALHDFLKDKNTNNPFLREGHAYALIFAAKSDIKDGGVAEQNKLLDVWRNGTGLSKYNLPFIMCRPGSQNSPPYSQIYKTGIDDNSAIRYRYLDNHDLENPGGGSDEGDSCNTALQIKEDAFKTMVDNIHKLGITFEQVDITSGTTSGSQTPDGGGGANGTSLDCENSSGALGWILCPVIRALSGAADWTDQQIEKELTINVGAYFGSNGQELYKLWSTFRTLSLSLLVLIALIMVISQALNFGPFDAYTVKKVLPRMVMAVVLITLSWELGKFFVQMSNDLGSGVRTLFYSVVGGKTINIGGITGGLTNLAFVGALGTGLALGAVGLLSFIGTAALALLIGLLFIIFRRLIVVMCVVTAPIAIVALILPNTQKVWKFWKESFQGALVIFPLITGLIAGGHVLAQVESGISGAGAATGGEGILNNVVVLILYIGPYFAIPLVFRFASGLIATLGGFANDKGRGGFDRLKGFRRKRAGDRIKQFREGGLYNDDGKLRHRLGNQLGTYMFNPDEKIPHMLGEKGVPGFKGAHTRLTNKINMERQKQSKELAQQMNEMGFNDQAARVVSGAIGTLTGEDGHGNAIKDLLLTKFGVKDKHGNLVMRELKTEKDYDDAADIMALSNNAPERHAAGALRSGKGHMLNLKREGHGYADATTAGGLIVASHGFAKEDDVVGIGERIERLGGGREFADMAMTQMEVNGKNSGLKVTYSHSRDEDGNIITGTEAGRDWDRALSKSYAEISTQKRHAVESDVGALTEVIRLSRVPEGQKDLAVNSLADGYLQEWGIDASTPPEERAKAERRARILADKKVNDPGLQAKAEAATKTITQMAIYTPGAGDNYTVAKQAADQLGINIPGDVPRDPTIPGGGAGAPTLGTPPAEQPPFSPQSFS